MRNGETMRIVYLFKILVLSMFFLLPVTVDAEELGALRLSRMQGDVQVQSVGMDEWLPAVTNLPLQPKDRLWVPEGAWAQVESRDASVIRLDAESSLEILGVEENALQLYLGSGQGYVNFRKRGESMLQIDTPVSSFRSYDDAVLNVALDDKGNVDLSVFQGEVYAESQSGEVRVEGGRMLTIDEGVPFLMELDSITKWEQRNKDWDKALSDGADNDQYLPPELSSYGRDLGRNGRWVSTPDYGHVWIPTSHISVDWAPYRQGRWVWIGNDYVWIGSEPWGWAPYHYGRWSHVAHHGWCWIPPRRNEVYWGPGYVSWIQTSNDVAWVPLAPGEMYYGRGHYGPHSTNIININIHTVIPGKNYRNSQVRNAVTVIPRDAFLSGKYKDGRRRDKGRENPFLRENIHVGQPKLEPQRMTRMPTIKEIPRDKRPPESIRSMPGRAGDGPRPTVRGGERPGFQSTPGTQPLAIPVSGVRSESGTKPTGGELNRTESMRDRRHGPERDGKSGLPEEKTEIKKDESREMRPSAPETEKSGEPVVPQVAPVPAEDKGAPSGFRGRPQTSEQGDRPRSFRERPTVNPAQPQERVGEPVQVQPQVTPSVAVPPASVPVPEQRVREEEKAAPSGFRGRPQTSEQGDRPRSFRERPTVNPAQPQERAGEPVQVQPQVAPSVAVPASSVPVPEQRVLGEEKNAPAGFRGRPQTSEQGDKPRSFREQPTSSPAVQQERISQPVPAQPQVAQPVAVPPPSAPEPRQRVREEEREAPSTFRGRPQASEQEERSRSSFRERPNVAPETRQERISQPVQVQPQVAAPPAPAPRPQVVAPPPAPAPRPQVAAPPPAQVQRPAPSDAEAGRRQHQRPEGKTDKEKKEEEQKALTP